MLGSAVKYGHAAPALHPRSDPRRSRPVGARADRRTGAANVAAARQRDAARVCGIQASARVVPSPALRPEEREARGAPTPGADAPGRVADSRGARGPGKPVAGHTRRLRTRTDFAQTRTNLRCSSTKPAYRSRPSPSPTPISRGSRRTVRGDRREGQPPPGAAPGQLRDPQVRAPGDQAPRHADDPLPGGAGGRDRREPRRRELHRRAAADKFAGTSRCTASISGWGRRHPGQPRRGSRSSRQALALLEPIYAAQLTRSAPSRIKAMDETPIKAGRAGPGKMKGGYFWPVYGERDEICFPFFEAVVASTLREGARARPPSRGRCCFPTAMAPTNAYAQKAGSRARNAGRTAEREFIKAQSIEPVLAAAGAWR
jgi:hypothetical protein